MVAAAHPSDADSLALRRGSSTSVSATSQMVVDVPDPTRRRNVGRSTTVRARAGQMTAQPGQQPPILVADDPRLYRLVGQAV